MANKDRPLKLVALIPLRGGSKSIPLKNIKNIGGQPLCYWVITAAQNCPEISEVWVSTDHPEIKAYCLSLGAKVLDRPAELATDESSTESVMLHFMAQVDFDAVVTIQATSPLTQSEHLSEAIRLFKNNSYDSLLTCVEWKRFFWDQQGKPINYDPLYRPRRQEFAGYLMENGAFYVTARQILEKFHSRLGGKIALYQMPPETATELDEPLDWEILDGALSKRKISSMAQRLAKVRHIISDFDGVFTDNLVWTKSDGDELVVSSKADSYALSQLLPELRLPLTVLTMEKNPVVERRCAKLSLPVITGIYNKKNFLNTWLHNQKLSWSEIAYLGNDLNDLECLEAAGFSAVPADAVPRVKKVAHFISDKPGGRGFIREFLELLLIQSAT